MEKTKVLYFVDRFLVGGIQTLIVNILKNINKNEIQIDFLILDDGNKYILEDDLREKGYNVYKLNNIWIRKPTDYYKYAKALDSFFSKHHDYKVVHLHGSSKNYMVLKYAKKYNIPMRIAHSHNIGFQTKSRLKTIVGDLLKNKLKKYATDYFACSKKAGEWLFGKKDVTIINNGINIDEFTFNKKIREEYRDKLGICKNELLFGHVGRFTNQKNHLFLIDIFKEIHSNNQKAKLLLVGSGELEEEIKNKVSNYELTEAVIFAGFQTNVSDYFQAMDVFLFPSKYEGLGIVLLEAQAAFLPCFASKDVVPNDVKITELVSFISLNETPKEWAKIISSSNLNRRNCTKDILKHEYSIKQTTDYLTKIYQTK